MCVLIADLPLAGEIWGNLAQPLAWAVTASISASGTSKRKCSDAIFHFFPDQPGRFSSIQAVRPARPCKLTRHVTHLLFIRSNKQLWQTLAMNLQLSAAPHGSGKSLPLAIRRVLPPLGNQLMYMLKMSSLVLVIGMEQLFRYPMLLDINRSWLT